MPSPPAGGLTALVAALLAGSLTVPAPRPPDASPGVRPQAAPMGGLSETAPVPDRAALAARLAGPLSDRVLGNPAALVVDATTGRVLFDRAAMVPGTPASTLKTAVAAAALVTFAPDRRLRTVVLHDPAGGGTLWLVGAGDPTLTAAPPPAAPPPAAPPTGAYPVPAGLVDLAGKVRAAGITTVSRVIGDGSLFVGPATAPGWHDGYITSGNVTPVSGLEVDGGRPAPGAAGPRSATPDAAAATAFAAALRDAGVTVESTGTGRARPGARRVAAAESPPVPVLVERMLQVSDNDLAESLGRLVARERGLPASFAGASRAVLDVLAELGVPTGGARLADVSGLSVDDRIAPATLVALLRTATLSGHENLRTLLASLPVAGFSGTLDDRFGSPDASAAAGAVRAKTGSLRTVTSLAGQVVDADGRLLLFAFLAPVTDGGATRTALDRVAVALAGCGCSAARPAAVPSAAVPSAAGTPSRPLAATPSRPPAATPSRPPFPPLPPEESGSGPPPH
jgi:D-alanyl-D-alanine carboxypeptidase/D-alanyl-D-alanine-endopeptidase (penicillin-binding protein 4)